jgi:hypothetical protein
MHNRTTDLAAYRAGVRLSAPAAAHVRLLATAAILLAVFGAGLAFVQYGAPGLVGNDGYYHIKMGYLIRTEGLKPAFPYLPLTILNPASFYDHHMLYHVYLAFFAGVDPAVDGGAALTQGAKMASIIMPAVAFLAIWWLLRGQNVPYAAVWSVALLALSEAFLYRMSMPRAQSASLLLLVLGLHWLLQGRAKWLLPLGAVYVWTYNAFPLLLILAGVYAASVWLLERRVAWQALAYPGAGILLGLLINPYFPANVDFIAGHLAPKLGASTTPAGNEWAPYLTWTLVQNSGVALGAALLGVLALGWHEQRIDLKTLVALGMTVVFGLMLFSSRRFVEYFPPFALVFLAFSVSPLLRGWQETWRGYRPAVQASLALVILLMLAYPLTTTLRDARAQVAGSQAPDHYAAAALWLRAHAGSGARIFQTDWDDFTRLFFYGGEAVYTAGLDPTFMELHDAALFEEWVAITRGQVARPSAAIRDRFGAAYVFSDLDHDGFLEQAAADPGLRELYRDEDAVIFAVQ